MSFDRGLLALVLAGALTSATGTARDLDTSDFREGREVRHVLLISIDGMHAVDFLNCAKGIPGVNGGAPYCPNLAGLRQTGINYRNASTSKPSDSFPGLTAIVSGGSPRSFGVYYDVAYDRVLAPPRKTTGNGVAGGTCTLGQPNGTTTEYEEGIDIDQALLNGGAPGAEPTDGGIASIDPTRLIRDPLDGCRPVFPWNFVRTNTIFGVIHENGGYTAWSDKHPAYASVSGPGDGAQNLNDFYGPEINSDVTLAANQKAVASVRTPLGESCASLDLSSAVSAWTDSFFDIRCYDTLKVHAILNEIAGKNHLGTMNTQVPTLFGMNFQAVSVGQKLIEGGVKGGYLDAEATPSEKLLAEIQFVDQSIGEMTAALKTQGKYESTLIIITSKHGQSPIDPNLFFPIPGHSGTNGESPATLIANNLTGYIPDSESPLSNGIGPTEDDVSLLWLAPGSNTVTAVNLLEANAAKVGLGQIYYGQSLRSMLDMPGLPPGDPRTPDIIVTPNVGVIYTGSTKKQEEHGGFAHDDTNVMLLLSNPSFKAKTVTAEVQTAQVAPTVLRALGLNPDSLDAVRAEGTAVLPGIPFRQASDH